MVIICVFNFITGSLGTQNVKVLNFQFSQKTVGLSQHFGLEVGLVGCHCSTLVWLRLYRQSEEGSKEIKPSGLTSEQILNFNEVKLELKLDGFHLRVMRGLTENTKTLPPPIPAPESINSIVEAPVSTSSSSAIFKPTPSSLSIQGFLDKVADEGLVIIQSPTVGFFRRSRTIKGKRTPRRCEEMQMIEEGQVICYLEQLGGDLPFESDVFGEVIRILRKDGAVLPSFPRIKKLQ
ncbi:unnamed protein product [Vicia faba]|uniref:Uncharacterized protein n=1 Tax=Vicia faba TaxID=3906 RepID=A0AAV1A9L4_VICFA|nr:unnamed protein product [Vicia faba]